MDLSFQKQTLGMNLDFVDDFRDSELTIEVCIERKNKLIPAASRYVEFRDACEKLLETADFQLGTTKAAEGWLLANVLSRIEEDSSFVSDLGAEATSTSNVEVRL
jgi:hypothetical protein